VLSRRDVVGFSPEKSFRADNTAGLLNGDWALLSIEKTKEYKKNQGRFMVCPGS